MKLTTLAYVVLFILFIVVSIVYGLFSFRFSGYPALIPLIIICWFIFKPITSNRFWITRAVPYKLAKGFAWAVFSYYIGMFLFLHICYGIAFSRHSFYSENIRFPICDIEWIDSQANGNIFCLSSTYSRLQVFDTNGRFLRGWFVRIPRGSYWISMCDNGDIILWEKEDMPCVVYDQFGNCIKMTDYHKNIPPKVPTTETIDKYGNTYKVKSDLLWPKIVKIDAKGIEQIVVKDPVGMWLHNFPFPYCALWFFSFLIGSAFSMRVSRPVMVQDNDIGIDGKI